MYILLQDITLFVIILYCINHLSSQQSCVESFYCQVDTINYLFLLILHCLEIVGWSLAKEAYIQSNNIDELQSYTVHDMILDYLKDTTDSITLQEYHRKLVERYEYDKLNCTPPIF